MLRLDQSRRGCRRQGRWRRIWSPGRRSDRRSILLRGPRSGEVVLCARNRGLHENEIVLARLMVLLWSCEKPSHVPVVKDNFSLIVASSIIRMISIG